MHKNTDMKSSFARFVMSFVVAVICLFFQACANVANNSNNLETRASTEAEFSVVLKAAQAGDTVQQAALGRIYANGLGVAKDMNQAIIWFRKSADQGNARGQAYLGLAYLNGVGGLYKDIDRALDLFQKSAAQNDAVGQAYLGNMYARGVGLVKDMTLAVMWFRKSADQGNDRGQAQLGIAYANSLGGLAKDDGQAAELFRKSAEQGNAEGQVNFGVILEAGRGVTKNERQAFSWYLKAANQDNAQAQLNLGNLYVRGRGVEKDERQALYWYSKAADQNSINAQFNLANLYAVGIGIAKDERVAQELYRKASIQGHKNSQENLARSYEHGLGSNVNNSLAYFWNLIASNNNYESSWVKKFEPLLQSVGQLDIKNIASLWKIGSPEPVFRSFDVPAPTAVPQPAPYLAPNIPIPRATPQPAPRITPNPAPPAQSIPNLPPSGTAKGSGSGFRVSSNQVVTNAHVVAGCGKLRVNGLAANLQASDIQVDLALISVNGLIGTIANIRSDAVRVGEDVAAAGYPLRGLLSGFNITRGNVSSLTGLGGDRRVFQITAPVQPGNSGGPLVDGSGNVAGVIVSKLSWKAAIVLDDIPQNVNFAVNLGALQTFLKANSVWYQAAGTSNNQFSLPDVAERAKHYTALVECL
jgi:uncharacterized protein